MAFLKLAISRSGYVAERVVYGIVDEIAYVSHSTVSPHRDIDVALLVKLQKKVRLYVGVYVVMTEIRFACLVGIPHVDKRHLRKISRLR